MYDERLDLWRFQRWYRLPALASSYDICRQRTMIDKRTPTVPSCSPEIVCSTTMKSPGIIPHDDNWSIQIRGLVQMQSRTSHMKIDTQQPMMLHARGAEPFLSSRSKQVMGARLQAKRSLNLGPHVQATSRALVDSSLHPPKQQ